MKADYQNWMPKWMIYAFLGGTVLAGALCVIFSRTDLFHIAGTTKTVLTVLTLILAVVLCCLTVWSIMMYRAFSYNGKRQMSRQIIEGTASYVDLPKNGKCLDVGCGSGALTIAVAKRNPQAKVTGIDHWENEYPGFCQDLCEKNAAAEGVRNVHFQKGDANRLDFQDETFDAVVSNYVYHNIVTTNRQAILLETLRTLKKGGTFAIHDIFSASKYGDMEAFVSKLRDMGYEKVELIDTTNGMFMTRFEATWMALSGSALLVGKK